MIKRTIKDKIINSIKNRPVTLVTGARQVGKSTICKEIVKELNFNYVSLDDIRERSLALSDPELFLSVHKWPLIIDEVQYAPVLFEVIESIVNKELFDNDYNYGMYLLTGSQAFNLMKGVTESLAGRVSIIKLPPLSLSEINGKEEKPFKVDVLQQAERTMSYVVDPSSLFETIVRGFYPELYKNTSLSTYEFYSNYVSTYIDRDISKLIGYNNQVKFNNFMEVLASLTGEELVIETIAKAIQVDGKTISSWINILVSSDIITLLESYNENSAIKRVVKRPKIYFRDTGLACYLAKISDPIMLSSSIYKGRFVETYIVNEIMKSYQNNLANAKLYYYRDTSQNEIDLVIVYESKLTLIECKSGISFNATDVKSFDRLSDSVYPIGDSAIICLTSSIYKLKDKVYALPITSI